MLEARGEREGGGGGGGRDALEVDARNGGEAADTHSGRVAEERVRVHLRCPRLEVGENDEHEAAHEGDDRDPLERLDAAAEDNHGNDGGGHDFELADCLERCRVQVGGADIEERVLEEVEQCGKSDLQGLEELAEDFVLDEVDHATDAALNTDQDDARTELQDFLHQHDCGLEVRLLRLAARLGVPRNEVHHDVLQREHGQNNNLHAHHTKRGGEVVEKERRLSA